MKMTSPYAIGFALGVAVSWPVYCSAQSTKLVVTEGHYIGYPTVAGAMAALTAQGLVAVPGPNGDVSIVEPDNERAWIFAGKDNPAYPSANGARSTTRTSATICRNSPGRWRAIPPRNVRSRTAP